MLCPYAVPLLGGPQNFYHRIFGIFDIDEGNFLRVDFLIERSQLIQCGKLSHKLLTKRADMY